MRGDLGLGAVRRDDATVALTMGVRVVGVQPTSQGNRPARA